MSNAAAEKRLATVVSKAVAEALAKGAPASSRRPRSRRREAEGDADPVMTASHEAAVRAATEHLESMGDCLDEAADHHEKAMDLLNGVVADLDTDIEDETGADSSQSDEKSAAARVRRTLARIRAQNGS